MSRYCSTFSLLILILSFSACTKKKTTVEGNVLIKGGKIYDGSGQISYLADLIIAGDSIKWIGQSDHIIVEVDELIDADGHIITPGFIDLHAHGDPKNEKQFKNFLAQGVTTIALGMDGGAVTEGAINSWLPLLAQDSFGINILPFIGHGDIRTKNGHIGPDKLSSSDIKTITSDIKSALEQGLWGVSMGLEYLPGFYADSLELREIAKVVGQYNALITSHIRNEDNGDVLSSISEMGELSQYCKTNISHIKVVFGQDIEIAKQVTDLLDKYNLTADLYPYTASYTGIGIVFPVWSKNPKQYAQIKKTRGAELADHLRNKIAQRGGPEATLFGTAPYKGKTLRQLSEEYNMPYELVLRDIVGPYGGSAAYFVMNEAIQKKLLKSDRVMVSSDGSPTMHHPRGYGSFSKIIEQFVVKDSLLTMAEAIYKMSGQAAEVLNLKNRGFIKKGNKADILIFKPTDIRTNANFEKPHALTEGLSFIFVNGKKVDIQFTNNVLSGRLLLKK